MKHAALLLLCLLTAACASASDQTFEKEFAAKKVKIAAHTKKISDHCWAISLKDRSNPATEIINRGHIKTAQCFEDEYMRLYHKVATRPMSDEEMKKQFRTLEEAYIPIYEDVTEIYCDICGLMTGNIVLTEYSKLMQQIVGDLVYNIYVDDLDYLLTDQ